MIRIITAILFALLAIFPLSHGQSLATQKLNIETSGQMLNLEWAGQAGNTYFLQFSPDLLSWSYVPTIEVGNDQLLSYGFDLDSDKMFFRLHYTNLATNDPFGDDFDNDSISNWDEVRLGGTGTSPLLADTNGDGIRDDNLVLAAMTNPDGAGLSPSLEAGLTGRWDFEDVEGGNAYANSIDVTYPAFKGGTVLGDNEGIISKASRYDENGDWLKINPEIFNQGNKQSISMWFSFDENWVQNKSTAVPSARRTAFWSYNPANTAIPKLVLSSFKAVNSADQQKIILSTYENGILEDLLVALVPHSKKIDDSKWHHLALTQNGGISSIWLDGIKLNEANVGNKFGNATPAGWFTIGKAFPVAATPQNDTNFRGKIDRLRTYSKALSAIEIQSLLKQDADGDALYDWFESDYRRDRAAYFDRSTGDDDRDGLTNIQEQQIGTHPRNYDSDGDLLPDGFEHQYQLDPKSNVSPNGTLDDPDSDGLSNIDEVIFGSDPKKIDTDGDGVSDKVESEQGSFPNDASDNGLAPTPDELIAIQLSVGDPSSSHSERYYLQAKDLESGEVIVNHQAKNFGVVSSKIYKQFRRGKSYSFGIFHAGTKPDQPEADYDYFSEVKFIVPEDQNGYVIVDPFDPSTNSKATPQNGRKVLESARDSQGEPLGTGDGEVTDFKETIAKYRAIYLNVDLDIDSNNNEGVAFEFGSPGEDKIEDDPELPGKIAIPNTGTTDTVPDWADGFNINLGSALDDTLTETDKVFTPFLLKIPVSALGLKPKDVKIRFNYNASDPASVTFDEVGNSGIYTYSLPANGNARIWKRNSDVRKKQSILAEPVAGDYIPNDVLIKWSDLAAEGEDQVKLYYENVSGWGLMPLSVDVVIGDQTYAAADVINITHANLKIDEVISNQISGNICNKLPTAVYGGEGNNPMLMSTRQDGKAYISLKVNIPGNDAVDDRVLVGVREVKSRILVVGAETRVAVKPLRSPALTQLQFTPDNHESDVATKYEAVWGWDANEDGKIQTSEVLGRFDKTPNVDSDGTFYTGNFPHLRDLLNLTTESQVNYSKNELFSAFSVNFNPLYSADFLEYFLTDDQDELTEEAEATRIIDPAVLNSVGTGLAHPVGAKWNAQCEANTIRAEFDDNSGLSDDVEGSDSMDEFLEDLAKENKALLAAHVPNVGDEGWKVISFTNRTLQFSDANETDLFYALNRTRASGSVKFKITRINDGGTEKIDVELELLDFRVDDTYDFAYGGAELPRQAAVVQSGHASDHGAPGIGRVFFNRIRVYDDPQLYLPDVIVLTP